MLLFLLPWLLAPEDEAPLNDQIFVKLTLFVTREVEPSSTTWLLLLAEIDGPSPEAHEAFGAFIGFVNAGLLSYSLRRSA